MTLMMFSLSKLHSDDANYNICVKDIINDTPNTIKHKIYIHSLHGFICYIKSMFDK